MSNDWMHDDYSRPHGELTKAEERNVATLAHIIPLAAMILSAGALGFVAGIILYVKYKNRGPFVRRAAANALNVQIFAAMMLLVCCALMLVLIGFFLFPIPFIWAGVLHILAAMRANEGEWYDPPLTPRIVR